MQSRSQSKRVAVQSGTAKRAKEGVAVDDVLECLKGAIEDADKAIGSSIDFAEEFYPEMDLELKAKLETLQVSLSLALTEVKNSTGAV